MLTEVWSGGQDGADIAGLRAARASGLQTGGWMPRGFRTASGDRPEYADLYGVRANDRRDYPPRTAMNVRQTDATLILGDDPESRGCALTIRCCERDQRPYLVLTTAQMSEPDSVTRIADWLKENAVARLNVAGDRDAPEVLLETWLRKVFAAVVATTSPKPTLQQTS